MFWISPNRTPRARVASLAKWRPIRGRLPATLSFNAATRAGNCELLQPPTIECRAQTMGGARRLGSREDARAKPFAEHLRDSYIRAEFRSIDDHAKPGRSTDPNRSYDRGDMTSAHPRQSMGSREALRRPFRSERRDPSPWTNLQARSGYQQLANDIVLLGNILLPVELPAGPAFCI